jgi:hypothetical protein
VGNGKLQFWIMSALVSLLILVSGYGMNRISEDVKDLSKDVKTINMLMATRGERLVKIETIMEALSNNHMMLNQKMDSVVKDLNEVQSELSRWSMEYKKERSQSN